MRDSGQDEWAINLHLFDIHHILSIIINIATVLQSLVDTVWFRQIELPKSNNSVSDIRCVEPQSTFSSVLEYLDIKNVQNEDFEVTFWWL